jgi:hypothetical protein
MMDFVFDDMVKEYLIACWRLESTTLLLSKVTIVIMFFLVATNRLLETLS